MIITYYGSNSIVQIRQMMGDRNSDRKCKENKQGQSRMKGAQREREKENQKGDEDLPLNGQHRSF